MYFHTTTEVQLAGGKIGAVGKVEIIQALHQKDGKRKILFSSSPQNGRTLTLTRT